MRPRSNSPQRPFRGCGGANIRGTSFVDRFVLECHPVPDGRGEGTGERSPSQVRGIRARVLFVSAPALSPQSSRISNFALDLSVLVFLKGCHTK
ncbi:unnamed protein product [Leptosia nina]|uniref:Uncharacterized protein n=1 Tax=Leptosia nina TaxID=320188 RepID=A0AAV1J6S5_9NEOP